VPPEEYADASLIREFLAEAEEHLATLDRDLLEIEGRIKQGAEVPAEPLEEMFRAVHTIKGLSAMFDFDAVRDLAHAIESVLDAVRKGAHVCDASCADTLFAGADALKEALHSAQEPGQGAAAAKAAGEAVRAYLQRSDSGEGRKEAAPERAEALSEFARARIEEATAEGLRPVRLRLRWGIELRLGALKLTALERALGAGEILDVRPVLAGSAKLSEVDPEKTDVLVEVVALTDVTDEEISDALGVVRTAIGLIGSDEAEEGTAEVVSGVMSKAAEHVVRVDIARLDDLMDLTGEIVTARTRLDDLIDSLKAREGRDYLTTALAQSVRDVGALIDLLQEHVMGLRMVPVRQLFSKFPRTVRDLARRSDKEIRLAFEGEETELDKRMIEQVEDSVLHMVRNACDHGIEQPEERTSAGKTHTGTVTLAASCEGNHVIIEVRDDGRGLDVLAIWQKAVESGMVSADEEIDDARLAELIMTTGFSTAREITDISGRGVGMDVVRKRIAGLGGSVRVSSEQGLGTAVTLRLPMTLAVLPSLLVGEVGRTFAIPSAAVSEVLRVRGTDIRKIRGNSVMDLRGEALPVVRLGSVLGIGVTKRSRDSKSFVAVVSAAGHRLGLAVDALEGQQQVVVKNLEEAVGRTAGISGATILGDGTVVPIIDVDSVVEIVAAEVAARDGNGGEGK
jgi:two-component system chemotaxis sensor kinase CheA